MCVCVCMFRSEQDQEVKDKLTTIEDLHGRLKCNVDTVQQLNTQVSATYWPWGTLVSDVNLCYAL